MKTIEDLKYIREQYKGQIQVPDEDNIQITIGMETCGIAAGAREVMSAILDEIVNRNLQNITIRRTSCIGMCEKEVLVDVVRPEEPRITYGNVTPETAAKIIADHVVEGRIVQELIIKTRRFPAGKQ